MGVLWLRAVAKTAWGEGAAPIVMVRTRGIQIQTSAMSVDRASSRPPLFYAGRRAVLRSPVCARTEVHPFRPSFVYSLKNILN